MQNTTLQLTDIIQATEQALQRQKQLALRFLIPMQEYNSYAYYGNIAFFLETFVNGWRSKIPYSFVFISFSDINLQQFIQVKEHILFYPIFPKLGIKAGNNIKEAFYEFAEYLREQQLQNPIILVDRLEIMHKRSEDFILLIEEILQILHGIQAPKFFMARLPPIYQPTLHSRQIPFFQFYANFQIKHLILQY